MPSRESEMFRCIVGVIGSVLCLSPLVALAHAVDLVALPAHGKALLGDTVLLVLVLAILGGGWRQWWRSRGAGDTGPGDDSDGGHGGDGGGREWGPHQFPLFSDRDR